MTYGGAPDPRPDFRRVRTAAATFTIALGLFVLIVGWGLQVEISTRIISSLPAMVPLTATCLVLVGVGLLVGPRPRRVLCGVTAIVAILTLIEYATGHTTVDRLYPRVDQPSATPGRMAIGTATSLLLLALGLSWTGRHQALIRDAAGMVVVSTTGLAFLGLLFDVDGSFSFAPLASMSLPTAIGLQVQGAALLTLVPGGIVDTLVRGTDLGAVMLRRFTPLITVVLPLLSFGAFELGIRTPLWDQNFSPAVIVALWIIVAGSMAWYIALTLGRTDRARSQALTSLGLVNADLESRARARAAAYEADARHMAVLEERDRIAADLHDRVIQDLFAAGLALRSGTATLDGPRETGLDAVDLIDRAIRDLRSSIHDLHSEVSSAPLEELERIAEGARRTIATVRLDVDDLDLLEPDEAEQVIAAAQEAVSNAVRHARARSLRIAVDVTDDHATLVVSDDGTGIDPDLVRSSRPGATGHGMTNLTSRAAAYGGSCNWTATRPGATRPGTTVTWQLRRALASEEIPRIGLSTYDAPTPALTEGLARCATILGRHRDGEDDLDEVLQEIMRSTNSTVAALTEPDPASRGRSMILTRLVGELGEVREGLRTARTESLAAHVMQTHRGLTIDDLTTIVATHLRLGLGTTGLGPAMLVPVPSPDGSGEATGSLFLCRSASQPAYDLLELRRASLLATFVPLVR